MFGSCFRTLAVILFRFCSQLDDFCLCPGGAAWQEGGTPRHQLVREPAARAAVADGAVRGQPGVAWRQEQQPVAGPDDGDGGERVQRRQHRRLQHPQ